MSHPMTLLDHARQDLRELEAQLAERDDELREALATIADQQATIQQLDASLERYRVAVANCIHSADRLAQVMPDPHGSGLAAFVNAHLEGLEERSSCRAPSRRAHCWQLE